jgi:hypothetical protein
MVGLAADRLLKNKVGRFVKMPNHQVDVRMYSTGQQKY